LEGAYDIKAELETAGTISKIEKVGSKNDATKVSYDNPRFIVTAALRKWAETYWKEEGAGKNLYIVRGEPKPKNEKPARRVKNPKK
jgi:hypothetical protein